MINVNQKIELGIVDDDLLVVQLLTDFFNKSDNITVSVTASSGNEILEKMLKEDKFPDILLLDLRMKDGNGLTVLDELQKQDTKLKVIVLSSFYKPSFIGQMLKLDVAAFLPKDIDRAELLTVIHKVYKEGCYFSHEQVNVLRSQVSSKSPKIHISQPNPLSEREKQVLELVCKQKTTREIAEYLFLSMKTIESHKSNLMLKTGVKNMAGLVIYAIQNKIVTVDELILLEN